MYIFVKREEKNKYTFKKLVYYLFSFIMLLNHSNFIDILTVIIFESICFTSEFIYIIYFALFSTTE